MPSPRSSPTAHSLRPGRPTAKAIIRLDAFRATSQRKGRAFYARLIEEFTLELIHHQRAEMAGLGVFAIDVRPEHTTQHPATGQPITIPAKKAIRYRSARPLRRRLNPKDEGPDSV